MKKNKKCLIYPVRPQICRRFMCNATIEDIEKAKKHFHETNRVVFMRMEFFGNMEDYSHFILLMNGVAK